MCRVYGVTRAGYYAWCQRPVSKRAQQDEKLRTQIKRVHEENRRIYGSPRVHRELKSLGVEVGENRVARLMRADGIKARAARRNYNRAHMKRFYASVPNRAHEVELTSPDQVWVGDITYLKVGKIYRYLAVVMDKYSRRILSWAFGKTREATLTLRALNQAVRSRRPPAGLIFHSDRGMEYASGSFKRRLARLGIVQSMNRKMNDNVYIESFFHSMKSDIVHGVRFDQDHEIVTEVRNYMPFYNHTRLHSSLGYVSPATYEQQLA
jgi:transposase InsO family protein